MPGVQGLEGVEGLLGQADLADDQPVGAHPQGIGDEVADVEQAALGLARREVVRVDRLEVEAVRVLEGELGRVLDHADPLDGSNRSVSERSRVVLPAPVSPATRTFALARTIRARKSAISGFIPPSVTQSRPCRPPGVRSSRRRLNLRIERYGPPTGGMTGVDARPVGHPGIDDRVGDR